MNNKKELKTEVFQPSPSHSSSQKHLGKRRLIKGRREWPITVPPSLTLDKVEYECSYNGVVVHMVGHKHCFKGEYSFQVYQREILHQSFFELKWSPNCDLPKNKSSPLAPRTQISGVTRVSLGVNNGRVVFGELSGDIDQRNVHSRVAVNHLDEGHEEENDCLGWGVRGGKTRGTHKQGLLLWYFGNRQ